MPGPHGGLTTVHGGGNSPLQNVFAMIARSRRRRRRPAGTALVLTRLDGLHWAFNGILAGSGYVAGDPYVHRVRSTSSSSARTSRA